MGLEALQLGMAYPSIGDGAFWGCSGLTSVIIGENVTWIAWQAFRDCSGLTSVKFKKLEEWKYGADGKYFGEVSADDLKNPETAASYFIRYGGYYWQRKDTL